MTPRQPTRADDEDLLNWLVLRDAGWPVSLIAAVWRVPTEDVAIAMEQVRVADNTAHSWPPPPKPRRPQPVWIGWDLARGPDRTVLHRVRP